MGSLTAIVAAYQVSANWWAHPTELVGGSGAAWIPRLRTAALEFREAADTILNARVVASRVGIVVITAVGIGVVAVLSAGFHRLVPVRLADTISTAAADVAVLPRDCYALAVPGMFTTMTADITDARLYVSVHAPSARVHLTAVACSQAVLRAGTDVLRATVLVLTFPVSTNHLAGNQFQVYRNTNTGYVPDGVTAFGVPATHTFHDLHVRAPGSILGQAAVPRARAVLGAPDGTLVPRLADPVSTEPGLLPAAQATTFDCEGHAGVFPALFSTAARPDVADASHNADLSAAADFEGANTMVAGLQTAAVFTAGAIRPAVPDRLRCLAGSVTAYGRPIGAVNGAVFDVLGNLADPVAAHDLFATPAVEHQLGTLFVVVPSPPSSYLTESAPCNSIQHALFQILVVGVAHPVFVGSTTAVERTGAAVDRTRGAPLSVFVSAELIAAALSAAVERTAFKAATLERAVAATVITAESQIVRELRTCRFPALSQPLVGRGGPPTA